MRKRAARGRPATGPVVALVALALLVAALWIQASHGKFVNPTAGTTASEAPVSVAPAALPAGDLASGSGPQSESGVVTRVIDGDTIDVESVGRIRIVGIDTPERGRCGYDAAQTLMSDLVLGQIVALTAVGTKDDVDKYGRLLRYIDLGALDAGLAQIRAGYAVARYDSRDGFGAHPREQLYIEEDSTAGPAPCGAADSATAPVPPAVTPDPQPASPGDPWTRPGPDLDCSDIGRQVQITGQDYHGLDADNDGWGCESYA